VTSRYPMMGKKLRIIAHDIYRFGMRLDSPEADKAAIDVSDERLSQQRRCEMAKGQRSNREKRKPKAEKPKLVATRTSPFAPAPGMGKEKGGYSKKGR
jgi:hypothetical protein